jgi:hypothetical protein
MKDTLAVLVGTLMSTASIVPAVMAEPACVTSSAVVPAGANTTDRYPALLHRHDRPRFQDRAAHA